MNEPADKNEAFDLEACVQLMATLSALPRAWLGREPQKVVEELLAIVVAALKLDLMHVRLDDRAAAVSLEAVQKGDVPPHLSSALTAEVALHLQQVPDGSDTVTIPSPVPGEEDLRLATLCFKDVDGVIHAGSRRPSFPRPLEATVLSAAVEQLATWILLTRALEDARKLEAKLAGLGD